MLGATSPSAARPAAETGATVKGAADARRADTAKEFEAVFLSMLLKEMRQTLDPDGGLFPGDTGDIQGGLFDLYLGRHLADSGGVGMAAAIARQLRPTDPGPPHAAPQLPPPAAPPLPRN
ncbi:MAG: hypothetical protein C0501_16530 [Isosphaera sp.]|nr:hypothetical protein [Isosphaera sp.]